ncbi:uncharacterized protein LOC141792183 isoform X2 [Halichoeres trimaculatus]|uniref:uncharacterized protein LOC141792183 isoform X2 n=1 Tax=Halichoeres trimaculatus TaxID=147232 RepID=UPI003D9EC9A5
MTSKPHGMIGNSGGLAAVLTVVSVLSLSLLSLFCLRCKKKSKIIHEENQIYNPQVYNPQTFQRGGSRFAVIQSKTVTRTSRITPVSVRTRDRVEEHQHDSNDDQSDYQNIGDAHTGSADHTYVAPLPITVYENDKMEKRRSDSNETPDVYVNVSPFPTKDDDDDYENSEFLKKQEGKENPHDQ